MVVKLQYPYVTSLSVSRLLSALLRFTAIGGLTQGLSPVGGHRGAGVRHQDPGSTQGSSIGGIFKLALYRIYYGLYPPQALRTRTI